MSSSSDERFIIEDHSDDTYEISLSSYNPYIPENISRRRVSYHPMEITMIQGNHIFPISDEEDDDDDKYDPLNIPLPAYTIPPRSRRLPPLSYSLVLRPPMVTSPRTYSPRSYSPRRHSLRRHSPRRHSVPQRRRRVSPSSTVQRTSPHRRRRVSPSSMRTIHRTPPRRRRSHSRSPVTIPDTLSSS